VGETSEQLSTAAQRFAADAMRIVDEATRKAELSANLSRESAVGAQLAAAEVRQMTETVRQSLVEAVEQVKQESRSFFQEAVQQTEQGLRASDNAGRQLEERLQQTSARLEEQVNTGREAAAQAMHAAQEAREAASEAGSNRHSLMGESGAQEAVAAAAAATETARATASEVANLREVIANAERAALEARQIAEAANTAVQAMPPTAPSETTIGSRAQEVLERLEADYSLLTKLVQELHARIASLSSQTSATVYRFTPPSPVETMEPREETSAPLLEEASQDTPGSYDYRQETSDQAWSSEPQMPDREAEPMEMTRLEYETPAPMADREIEPAEEAMVSESQPVIGGRVLVSISPVPDFDRLLSLDGALGRMSGVGNVTLADYAREEVTFRLEVDPPTSVDEFRERLSQSAGANIEVVTSAQDTLTLRLAS
jgi:hypothetical protein